ncbi:VRR-NUC domain-containing protein [Vibrio ulleungensis]|uniref:phosphodiesterase I n=1 Tax=Vibrio ulleungensis TaxID=2807619 RepID=A0ABS2HC14_9VIBR|nr:VRR-NUC domain-containing protein [Vibrio ulleungensis]MBM7035140.1 VRR-NUC domain-containing protein [Vibrio ulleungensis]
MASEKIELPVGYYLENFRRLVDHAQKNYSSLITEQESCWLATFASLSVQGQRLTVRLLTRKGVWFRSDKLSYQEIPDIEGTLTELQDAEIVHLNPPLSAAELGTQLLTKNEIIQRFPVSNKQLKKPQLIEELSQAAQVHHCSFTIVQLLDNAILDTLLLLFFANYHQDQSQFILEDLGVHKFENYALDEHNRFYQHRQQLESLRLFSQLSDDYYDRYRSLPKDDKISALEHWYSLIDHDRKQYADPSAHSYTHTKRQSLVNLIARDFERLGMLDKALELFNGTELPPSRERRARILLQQQRINEASSIIDEMLERPLSIEEQEVAQRLLTKRLRAQGEKVPRTSKPRVDEDFIQLDLSIQRVELAAADYYRAQGFEVYYVENAFLCGLFGLLYWDAIFAAVDGAFINPYQAQPKNLYSSRFAQLRQVELNRCRVQFEQHGYRSLSDTLKRKQDILNPFVYWSLFNRELLSQAEQCLPPDTLLQLTDIILSDRKAYRAGMPDLVAFRDGQTFWIEVKGPGDKLQDNQWRWIKHFQALQLPIRVCYVNHQ